MSCNFILFPSSSSTSGRNSINILKIAALKRKRVCTSMWRSEKKNRIKSLTSHERLHFFRATKLLGLPGNSITAKLYGAHKVSSHPN